ncbi:MAG TPA: efflux RND transporter periplasmic adaptor subunit [Steroidobacteraceae bacterium]|nr:efflux RND transporter periplasmic adaptor subunit [Steroidobacteraceae bacterium]
MNRNTVIGIAAALALAGCGNGQQPAAEKGAAPVRVAVVETAPATESLRAVGVVAPADEVRLSFKSGGVVRSIEVQQGERVRAGQLLATLVQDEVAAAVAQARAVADQAARDLERGRALLSDEVATREQVEGLATANAVAQAQLRTAVFNARHSRIEAPADGVVLRKLAEPDELVAAGQPVLVVGNTGGGWIVRAALSDRDVVRVQAGLAAEVSLDAFPGRSFAATVTEIAAAADPQTGTYEMKLAVDPAGARFVQGLVAKVVITDDAAESVAVVPVTSLLEADGREATVFVVAGSGVAKRVAVRTGRLLGERIEVLGGLSPGDRVVTEGAAWLDDNDAVRVLDAS